ncbi:MAG: hypothetical protein ACI4JQ_01885 [Ruminococcus sp.]
MNKKSVACIAYMVLAFGVCVIPAAAMPFANTEQTSENRVLSAMPSLLKEDGSLNKNWGTEFESYFSDHFAFRQNMADTYDRLVGSVLRTSVQKDVIIGSDDWLYYTPTVEDYINQAKVTETGAKHMSHVLEMMCDYAEAHGAKFVFTSAPNKNSVYGAYMPARYICSDEADTLTLLEEALADTDVCYCDLRTLLSEKASESSTLLYHKWDTHWNNYGAQIAFDALMDTAGAVHTDYTDIPYTVEQNWDGDLYQMIYPASDEKDSNMVYDYDSTYTYVGRFRSVDDLIIRTQCEGGQQSLLMFRDSFGRALIPFMAEDFASASFQRADHYPLDSLESTPADVVIVEMAERNLTNLLGYAPQMPAPVCTISEADRIPADCTGAALSIEKSGSYLHLYGTYDAAYADHDGIFVTISAEDGTGQTYEAFPCYEYALLKEDVPCENGYSLYIPTETFDTSVQTVQITVLYDGHYMDLGTAGQFQLGAS